MSQYINCYIILGDDEFYSNPSEGKIAFTTPSAMELFNADLSDFNGSGILPTGWEGDDLELYTGAVNSNAEAEG